MLVLAQGALRQSECGRRRANGNIRIDTGAFQNFEEAPPIVFVVGLHCEVPSAYVPEMAQADGPPVDELRAERRAFENVKHPKEAGRVSRLIDETEVPSRPTRCVNAEIGHVGPYDSCDPAGTPASEPVRKHRIVQHAFGRFAKGEQVPQVAPIALNGIEHAYRPVEFGVHRGGLFAQVEAKGGLSQVD
jgi:hypothetical protein